MAYASHLKLLIKSMVPKPVLESYRRHRRSREHRRNALMTTEDVFTEIYSQNKWGGG